MKLKSTRRRLDRERRKNIAIKHLNKKRKKSCIDNIYLCKYIDKWLVDMIKKKFMIITYLCNNLFLKCNYPTI